MMATISTVIRLGRIVLIFALTMAFAIHSPIACQAAHQSCHHGMRSDAPSMPCCKTPMCDSIGVAHDAVTPAPSLANTITPAIVAYIAARPSPLKIACHPAGTSSPPAGPPLILELQILRI
jgi:hypothetical protein